MGFPFLKISQHSAGQGPQQPDLVGVAVSRSLFNLNDFLILHFLTLVHPKPSSGTTAYSESLVIHLIYEEMCTEQKVTYTMVHLGRKPTVKLGRVLGQSSFM